MKAAVIVIFLLFSLFFSIGYVRPTVAAEIATPEAALQSSDEASAIPIWMYVFMSVLYVVVIQLAMQMRTQFDRFLVYGAFVFGGVIGFFFNNYLFGFFAAVLLSLLFW